MPQESLKNKAQKGLLWSTIDRIASQGTHFVFGILIARLLSPDDYGIIAMPLVFLAVAQCFIDSGFATALVRKPTLSQADLSTAFFFNIGVGVICYSILFLGSPLIASFYSTPLLGDVLKFTALATLFNPLCAVQQALLTRKIDFYTQAKVSFFSCVISGSVALFLACKGFGIWALVVQQVSSYFFRTLFLWSFGKWIPTLEWSKESFNYLWGFGNKMLGSGLLDTIYTNLYTLVIGKFYNASDLGNYTRAQQFASLPSSNITGVLQRVTFPVLSKTQDDDVRLYRNYRKILKITAFVVFPLMLLLSALANPIILLLLSEKWSDCILLLKIICFGLMLYPVHAINLNLLTVKGRSDLFLKLEIYKKIIGVLILCLTLFGGLVVLVIGGVFYSVISLVLNTYYTNKLIGVGLKVQFYDMCPIFLCSLLMWVIVSGVTWIFANLYIQLFVGATIGIFIYGICSFIFLKSTFYELKEYIPNINKNGTKKG